MFFRLFFGFCFCKYISFRVITEMILESMPLTSERHGGSCLGVHLNVARLADLADAVAHRVAAAFPAAQAHPAVEHVVAATSVRLGRFLLVQQGVDEQVNRTLVFTLDCVRDS